MPAATGAPFSQYGFSWDYRQRTKSFYAGKTLPAGVELVDNEPTQVPQESRGASGASPVDVRSVSADSSGATQTEGGDAPDLP